MTGKRKSSLAHEPATPELDTSSQEAKTNLGTDSVTDAIGEQVLHEQKMRSREETILLQEKACKEVEEYINHYLVNPL